jgi:hypothetical protein
VPREKSVARFKDQIRNLTQRRAPVTLRDMIEVINPIELNRSAVQETG